MTASDRDTVTEFRTLTYSLIGLDTAPTYFSINPSTGELTIKASLEQDTVTRYIVCEHIPRQYLYLDKVQKKDRFFIKSELFNDINKNELRMIE